MKLSYKTPLVVSDKQEMVLWDLAEKNRLIYNFALDERQTVYNVEKTKPEEQRKYITYEDQQNQLPPLKKQFPEYKWVYSKVLQMTLKKLDANFKSFFGLLKNGHTDARPPNFRGKSFFFTLCYNQSGFKLEEKMLILSHKHPSGVLLAFELDHEPLGDIIQVEVFQDFKKRWFASITCEVETPPYIDNGLYQAFDPGILNIVSAVNLHGKFTQFANKRPDLYWKDKIAEVQQRRDFCKKKSRRWHHYHKKLGEMKRKLKNQMKDFQHKTSKVCVENTRANTLIVGKPAVKKMAKKKSLKNPKSNKAKKTLNHSLQNTGSMRRFTEFLTYKAKKIGKRVIEISERNTTRTCCMCGKIERKKLSHRVMNCNCGNTMDRDLNSAINILLRYFYKKYILGPKVFKSKEKQRIELENFPKKYLLQEPSVDEESFLKHYALGRDLLRQTAKRKTKVTQTCKV